MTQISVMIILFTKYFLFSILLYSFQYHSIFITLSRFEEYTKIGQIKIKKLKNFLKNSLVRKTLFNKKLEIKIKTRNKIFYKQYWLKCFNQQISPYNSSSILNYFMLNPYKIWLAKWAFLILFFLKKSWIYDKSLASQIQIN